MAVVDEPDFPVETVLMREVDLLVSTLGLAVLLIVCVTVMMEVVPPLTDVDPETTVVDPPFTVVDRIVVTEGHEALPPEQVDVLWVAEELHPEAPYAPGVHVERLLAVLVDVVEPP